MNAQSPQQNMTDFLEGRASAVYPEDLKAAISALNYVEELSKAYGKFRGDVRNSLFQAGVVTSFAWSDENIIEALKSKLTTHET